jgi:hypothetical protein
MLEPCAAMAAATSASRPARSAHSTVSQVTTELGEEDREEGEGERERRRGDFEEVVVGVVSETAPVPLLRPASAPVALLAALPEPLPPRTPTLPSEPELKVSQVVGEVEEVEEVKEAPSLETPPPLPCSPPPSFPPPSSSSFSSTHPCSFRNLAILCLADRVLACLAHAACAASASLVGGPGCVTTSTTSALLSAVCGGAGAPLTLPPIIWLPTSVCTW